MNSLVNKVTYLQNLISSENLLMLAVEETWLVEDVVSSYVDIDGFTFFRKDVGGLVRKHGVGLYVLNTMNVISVDVEVSNVLVVFIPESDLHVVVVYRPPSYNDAQNDDLSSFISEFSLAKNLLILGV